MAALLLAAACSGGGPDEDAGAAREVPPTQPSTTEAAPDAPSEPVALRLAVGTEWSGDPADAGPASVVTRVLADLLHEGVTRLDESGEPEPALAEEWFVSDDRLRWTFVFDDDLTDGDGEPLTARDVRRSLDRVASRGVGDQTAVALTAISGWQDRMSGAAGGVAGLIAPNDTTLVIELDRPFELLPTVLASPPLGIAVRGDDGWRTTGAYRYGVDADVLVAVDSDGPVARIELVDSDPAEAPEQPLVDGTADWVVMPAGQGSDALPGSVIRQPLDLQVGVAVRLADADTRRAVLAALDPVALTAGVAAISAVPSAVEDGGSLPDQLAVDIPPGDLGAVATKAADQLEAQGVLVERVEVDEAEFAARVASGDAVVFPTVITGGVDPAVTAVQAFGPGAADDLYGAESTARAELVTGIEEARDIGQRDVFVDALVDAAVNEGLMRVVGRFEVRLGVGAAIDGLDHRADGTLILDDVTAVTEPRPPR